MGFGKDTRKIVSAFLDGSEETVRGATILLFAAIIKASPVGEGRFRGNWFASGVQPSTKVTFDTDVSGNSTITNMSNVIGKLKNQSQYNLTNNLPYAEALEDGSSQQAPQGIVKVNVLRFDTLIEQESKKHGF